jgi:hypothetical protein
MNPAQEELPISVDHRTVDNIEMGILDDGTPYLSARGLSRLCGVAPSVIITLGQTFDPNAMTGRDAFIRDRLRDQGADPDHLCAPTTANGRATTAFFDTSCMAVLEYYAFEARSTHPEALRNYRTLARISLRAYIYQSLGYGRDGLPSHWQQYLDRVRVQPDCPDGHFIVFAEIASMVVTMIKAGVFVNHATVPDISVGQAWAKWWAHQDLEGVFGPRVKTDHLYPDYFPQAESNPQQVWAYPDEALAEFRSWFKSEYLTKRFPAYVSEKVRRGDFMPSKARAMIDAVRPVLELADVD